MRLDLSRFDKNLWIRYSIQNGTVFVNNKCKLKGHGTVNFKLYISNFYCIPEYLALSSSPSLKMTDQSLLSIAQALIKLDEFFYPPCPLLFLEIHNKSKETIILGDIL